MDYVAINKLREHYEHTVRSAETYREAAERMERSRASFYHALATTYERAAREMQVMLDAAERANGMRDEAA